MTAGSRGRFAAQIAVVAAAYAVTGKLGLELAFANSSITAIWAPTGIALAALVLGGFRLWPGVAIGAVLANVNTGVPAVTVLGIATGNTLEALTGAYLLERFGFRPSLERVRDVITLLACAAVVSTMVAATIGVLSLSIGDAIDSGELAPSWRTWWLGDMGGDLIVAPALMIIAAYRPPIRPPGGVLEGFVLAALLGGVSLVLFSHSTAVTFAVFPLLIWAALRFWQPGAVAASFIVGATAIAFTANEKGPFAMNPPDDRLLLAQTFVAVAGITTLVLAALTYERRRAELAQHEIAETLQSSLFPGTLPLIPKLDAAAFFKAAGERHKVGGDFYDLFEIGPDNWAVTVGDVCGKGARAAALTALARHTLRAASLRDVPPSEVLASLNEAVRRHEDPEALCTAIYASLDLGNSGAAATIGIAGHPLPLALRGDGRAEQLGAPGTLLGFDVAPAHTDHSVKLEPGDTLILYTDGLLDAYAPEEIAEVSELLRVLESRAGARPEELIAAIERSLLDDSEREPRDDIAIVAIRVNGRSEAPA